VGSGRASVMAEVGGIKSFGGLEVMMMVVVVMVVMVLTMVMIDGEKKS